MFRGSRGGLCLYRPVSSLFTFLFLYFSFLCCFILLRSAPAVCHVEQKAKPESQRPNLSAHIVLDLAHGEPAFVELEAAVLQLARILSAGEPVTTRYNVTILPIADAHSDFASSYVQKLRTKVEQLFSDYGSQDRIDDDTDGMAMDMRQYGGQNGAVQLASVPVYHHFTTQSRSIQRSYSLYTWLKEEENKHRKNNQVFRTICYYTDWGGAAYYSLLAKEQGLSFEGVSFRQIRWGTRAELAGLRGVVSTTDLLSDVDEVRTAYMEEESKLKYDCSHDPFTSLSSFFPLEPPQELLPPQASDIIHEKNQRVNPTASSVFEFVYVGSFTQADGMDLFTKAMGKLLALYQDQAVNEEKVASKKLPPIHVTFLGGQSFLNPKIAVLSKRKRLGQSKVEKSFGDWVEGQRKDLEGTGIELNVHLLETVDQHVNYFNQRRNAIAVLCNTKYKQRFVRDFLRANKVKLLVPHNLEASPSHCSFKETSSGLFRSLKYLVTNADQLSQCRLDNFTSSEVKIPSLGEIKENAVAVMQSRTEVEEEADVRVSCVVTHYNRGHFLLQAVSSLLGQTHTNLEIIIVDDGSTDEESLDILRSLENEHEEKCINNTTRCVKVVRIENSYLGAARNIGLQHARGEFVLFMDDDNYAKPHEVSTFLRVMLKTDCSIAACASEYLPSSLDPRDAFNATLYRQETPKIHIPLGPSVASGLFTNTFGDANLMLRKSKCANFSWPEDDAYSVQDWEVLARETTKNVNKIHLIPEPLFYYRTTSTSMAQTASMSSISQYSDQLYMRAFMDNLPLGLGPLVPYLVDLRTQVEESIQQQQELSKKNKMLTTILKPLVVEHCKYQKIHNADPFSKNVVKNPFFSEWNHQLELYRRTGQLAKDWDRYESGYGYSKEGSKDIQSETDNISSACSVTLSNIGKVGGAMQEVIVHQMEPKPLLLHGWSKALNVSGAGQPDDYSLYADITYMDGSHEWAFTAPFDQNKEGWQEAFGVIDYPKPIHAVLVVLMFRWRTGSVLFDNITLTNLQDGICGVQEF